jgi:hypothetical protein
LLEVIPRLGLDRRLGQWSADLRVGEYLVEELVV